jgi:hypothetical protein
MPFPILAATRGPLVAFQRRGFAISCARFDLNDRTFAHARTRPLLLAATGALGLNDRTSAHARIRPLLFAATATVGVLLTHSAAHGCCHCVVHNSSSPATLTCSACGEGKPRDAFSTRQATRSKQCDRKCKTCLSPAATLKCTGCGENKLALTLQSMSETELLADAPSALTSTREAARPSLILGVLLAT